MGRRKRTAEIDESRLGVVGVARTAKTLSKLNQLDGFDCQGCAWPNQGESTKRKVEPEHHG